MIPSKKLLLGTLLVLASTASTVALNVSTHRLVNRQAVLLPEVEGPNGRESSFSLFLRAGLGLPGGLLTRLKSSNGTILTVTGWLEAGGDWEDNRLRFLRHFHDPLKTWAESGLDRGNGPYESSIRWTQNPEQAGVLTGETMSWSDARRFYWQSQTAADAFERDARLADTFRALGHIMHLVVDSSNPEHTRNTQHPNPWKDWTKSYEYWVSDGPYGHGDGNAAREQAFIARFLSAPVGFNPAILQQLTNDPVAKVPVARLIDTDTYNGTNPQVTLTNAIGLGEIANANFFTSGTFDATPMAPGVRQYPFPSLRTSGLTRENLPVPRPAPFQDVRAYVSRPEGLGLLPAKPLAAVCASHSQRFGLLPEVPCLDDAVWGEIARHMLPRAVGYARGVLDYFFRGKMTVTVEWDRFSAGMRVKVKNVGAEEMDGVFEIYARHKPGTPLERRVKVATLANGVSVRLGPNAQSSFDTTFNLPADWTPTSAMAIVFKGRLGLEDGAVVGQVFTVPWVEVKQTSYTAHVTKTCEHPPAIPRDRLFQGTFVRLSEFARCDWYPASHTVRGTIATNQPIDPATGQPQRVIQRIEPRWFRATAGGPVLVSVDGGPAASVWVRQGNEPDPTTFEILDPNFRGTRAFLGLFVTYTGGPTLGVQLATFGLVRAQHSKALWETAEVSPAEFLVTSDRGIDASLEYNWFSPGDMTFPFFEAVAIGGVAVPTDTTTSSQFYGVISKQGVQTLPFFYTESVNDNFETFTNEDASRNHFAGISLVAPHPSGPRFNWTATLVRSFYAKEREFHRLFVAETVLPHQIEMLGHPAGE